ncbi:MAG: sigma-70 family RNA polymerase sigma factor [Thermodesulfobacteriota bacterium]
MDRRFQDAGLKAFEEFIRKYEDRIYNLCRYMMGNQQDAQDAAQDAFLKAYKNIGDFRPEASLYSWLYRIAVNTCLDHKKKKSITILRDQPVSEEEPSGGPSPEATLESKRITETVQSALQQLPKKLRPAIVLREIEGLSYEEIAEVLHTSVGTVKSRISRAREELRRILLKRL